MPVNGLFQGVDASASAMRAERLRMTVASENLANAGSTRRLDDGMPYARQRVVFRQALDEQGRPGGAVDADIVPQARYAQRYEPDHPDADPETGIVIASDIDPILELTDLMIASKAYQANVNAVKGLMRLHDRALSLGDR